MTSSKFFQQTQDRMLSKEALTYADFPPGRFSRSMSFAFRLRALLTSHLLQFSSCSIKTSKKRNGTARQNGVNSGPCRVPFRTGTENLRMAVRDRRRQFMESVRPIILCDRWSPTFASLFPSPCASVNSVLSPSSVFRSPGSCVSFLFKCRLHGGGGGK